MTAPALHRHQPPDRLSIADVEFMLATREWPPRIAERLHMSLSCLARHLYRQNRPDLAHVFEVYIRDARRRK